MNYECLLWDVKERIALVTFNRPKALNALSPQVFTELYDACARVESDDSIGAMILTGSGEKAFVAGADIKYLSTVNPVEGRDHVRWGQKVFGRLAGMSKPTIAAVNGFALGGGCEVAMACHMRVASETAKFGQPEVKLGLIPGYAGTQRLPRLIGLGRALEWLLTGNMMDATEAYRIGLVNRVTSPEELLPTARKIAEDIMKVGPVASRFMLEVASKGVEMSFEDAQNLEATFFGLAISTEDAQEGIAAFLEKRPAKFQGK